VNFEAMIKRDSRPYPCEFRNSRGSYDQASLEMHLVAVIVLTGRP